MYSGNQVCALQLAQACAGACCSGEVETTPAAVDATVTAAEPTSSSDEEQADVASHPLPDMFGAQVCCSLDEGSSASSKPY